MATHVFVELDSGEQEFFDSPYEAFKFAKTKEGQRKNSVEYVAIGDFYEDSGNVYRGQQLRNLIRSMDNVVVWLRTQMESNEEDISESS